jgi:flagellin
MRIDSSIQQNFSQLSTGKRINSASNDPAGLAISNKLTAQVNGYDKGTENALASQDLSKTAEGALSSINDSLLRIRELAVQASSGTYSNDDKKIIQNEITQLKEGIQETARGTEFNTLKLLDGSFTDKAIASSPSGTGSTMTIKNTSLETLGIDNFDVTTNFNIEDIDNAISQVSESRANLGAVSNALDSQINSNNISSLNLRRSEDQISSADMAKTITDMKSLQFRQQIQIYAQQNQMNQSSSVLNLLK